MPRKIIALDALLIAAIVGLASSTSLAGNDNGHILRIDHQVPHGSSVPANAGELVNIFVRERVLAGVAQTFRSTRATGKVVLFVHGGSVPSVPDYDLDFKDYNWMASLAQAGFDVFSMDQTGYGGSPRPMMDDPCNVNPAQQAILIPNPLPAPCPPSYPFRLTTSQSDWDEIDTVVDYIRALRGVDRVSIAGWSGGGPRGGGYAARHPEKVDKLILYAPGYNRLTPSDPPAVLPQPGFPMSLQTRPVLMEDRWQAFVQCEGQVDPGIREVIWDTIMSFDAVGRTWGPPEGVMRVRTASSWGWNAEFAARVQAPTLIIVGEQDGLFNPDVLLFEDLGTQNKVFVGVACATHFLVWETGHKILHTTSKEWLLHGSINGVRNGVLSVDPEGRVRKE